MTKNIFEALIKASGNEFATIAADGVAAGDITDYYDTGSYTFNAILSGSIYNGLPNNGVTAFAGEKSTGKSYMSLSVAKHFLNKKPNGMVFYFETESAITQESIINRGIPADRFAVVPVGTVEEFRTQALNIVNTYAEADGEKPEMLFILDSLGGLSTLKEITDIGSGKEARDMTRAQLIKGAFRVLTLKLGFNKIPMICTNHVYDVVGSYVPTKKQSGGSGLDYAASTITFLSKKKNKDKDGKVTGAIISAVINKGRLTVENTKVEALLDYANGLDRYYGLLDLAEKFGIAVKTGNKYEFPNGTKGFESEVENNPEKFFTKDVLDLIDAQCQIKFKYGGATKPVETVNEAVEVLTRQTPRKKVS
jgi:RecA/RadA recombinase